MCLHTLGLIDKLGADDKVSINEMYPEHLGLVGFEATLAVGLLSTSPTGESTDIALAQVYGSGIRSVRKLILFSEAQNYFLLFFIL